MYNVLDVAKFFICTEEFVSNLRLQKLLYFAQAAYLSERGRALFEEDIVAWDFGPVVLSVYYEYKMFGAGSIPYQWTKSQDEKDADAATAIPNEDDRILLRQVSRTLEKYSDSDLVTLTHQQTPWIDARFRYTRFHEPDPVISKESILKFFRTEDQKKNIQAQEYQLIKLVMAEYEGKIITPHIAKQIVKLITKKLNLKE